MGDEVLMSGGDGVGRMEFNKETWNAAGAGAENEFVIKRNESTGTVASGNDSIVRWEKFLPKMILRVLLVEADDSTRQIIAALLRKCNYRVSAVSDGLKAWEVMKSRPQNIDLILTEVDLPSISGFALLTLIMEHSICKNIPVIMMSSQDSVNTVYKCMLRGAADFLVKPVRKNELKNLWQHVWRRQASSSSGIGPPDESVAQQTLEATAENIDTSNCLSADIVGFKRSREGVEKGSDDQSSCTKPESEVEGTELNCKQDLSYSKLSKTSSTKGSPIIVDIDCKENSQQDTPKTDDDSRCFDFNKQACGDNHALNSSKEAIDLIGAFDKHLDCINNGNGNSYVAAYISMSTDSLPFLDLSLKSPLPYVSTNNVMEERCSLKHSDASAFSRYVNKTPCFRHSLSPTPCNQLDNLEAISDKQIFPDQSEPVIIISPKSMPLASDQPEKIENRLLLPPLVPFTGSKFQSIGPPPPAFYTLTGTSQMQSPDPVNHQETSFQASFNPLNNPSGDYLPSCNNPPSEKSVPDRSANSGMCNGTHVNLGPESNGKVESVSRRECVEGKVESVSRREFGAEGKVESLSRRECGVEDSFRVHVGDSFRSAQREAALTKFRLKRKDRCFEKKVRYESRKKLAEKRPRVKGQFVCQLSNHGKSSLV